LRGRLRRRVELAECGFGTLGCKTIESMGKEMDAVFVAAIDLGHDRSSHRWFIDTRDFGVCEVVCSP
jgi:hypothetical protein